VSISGGSLQSFQAAGGAELSGLQNVIRKNIESTFGLMGSSASSSLGSPPVDTFVKSS
jgi:hypothetical protein